jgi:hypothetical protein
MGGTYPYMDLNAKYEKLLLRCFTTIDPNETGIATLISYRHYLKIVGNNKL